MGRRQELFVVVLLLKMLGDEEVGLVVQVTATCRFISKIFNWGTSLLQTLFSNTNDVLTVESLFDSNITQIKCMYSRY